MENLMQSLVATRSSFEPAAASEDTESRLAQIQYLRFLMGKFEERASGREIQELMLAIRYWVAEEAAMSPESREDVDLIGSAFLNVSPSVRTWLHASGAANA